MVAHLETWLLSISGHDLFLQMHFFKVGIAIFSIQVSLRLTIRKVAVEGTIVAHDQATQWMNERKTYSINNED